MARSLRSTLSDATNTTAKTVFGAASKQKFTVGKECGQIELSGDIATKLTGNLIIALVPDKHQHITANITNIGFSLANAYLLPSLSTAIGVTINPISAIDMNSLTLAQIKNKLESMDKKLDKLLTSEMQLAINKCDKGLFLLNKLDKKNHGPDVKKRAAKEAIEEFRYTKIFLELAFSNFG